MHPPAFIDSNIFQWVILPFLIFLARILDVSIGTVRLMLQSKGKIYLAPILGFFEMLVWLLAVRQVVLNLTNWACMLTFAGGFAMGNYVGLLIEEKLALGRQVIRIITPNDATNLINSLNGQGYGATILDAKGAKGKVNVILTIIERSDKNKVIELVKKFNPRAFYTIEDVRSVSEGVFPSRKRR